jgi:hypothetical protein
MEILQYFGDVRQSKEQPQQQQELDSAQEFFKMMTEFAIQCTTVTKDLDDWMLQVVGLNVVTRSLTFSDVRNANRLVSLFLLLLLALLVVPVLLLLKEMKAKNILQ